VRHVLIIDGASLPAPTRRGNQGWKPVSAIVADTGGRAQQARKQLKSTGTLAPAATQSSEGLQEASRGTSQARRTQRAHVWRMEPALKSSARSSKPPMEYPVHCTRHAGATGRYAHWKDGKLRCVDQYIAGGRRKLVARAWLQEDDITIHIGARGGSLAGGLPNGLTWSKPHGCQEH